MTRDKTAEALLASARSEFLRYGFDGTDVNRIARHAGSSPNTFYRSYSDKTDVFIAVFRGWMLQEQQALKRLLARDDAAGAVVDACIALQATHAPFRRSLRRLGQEEPRVRRAVAEARLATLHAMKLWFHRPNADEGEMAIDLICFEQLAAAVAEGELAEMGFDDRGARARLAAIVERWRHSARAAPPIPVLESEALLA